MNVSTDKLSDTRVRLTITLDKKELADAERVALHKMAKNLKVPGFRKGKVPLEVAAKHVDHSQLAMETADNAISSTIPQAFESEKLQALSRPEVEVTEIEPKKSLTYTAEADVLPDVKLGNYKKLKAPKQEKIEIKKSEVDEVVERIKGQMATKKSVKREAKDGDSVVIDFVGKKDGVAFEGGAANSHELVLGSNSFIPGFESGIVGHKPGDTFTLELNFPEDYHVKDLAGADVTFDVSLIEVYEQQKPEETDEWAAKVGPYTSAKELRDDIKRELQAQAERSQNDSMRGELVKQLVESSTVPVPQTLREDQLQSIEQDVRQNLQYRGVTFEQWLESEGHEDREAWVKAEAGEVADARVAAGLVLAELSKVENITASNDELTQRIEAMKQQYAARPDAVAQLSTPDAQRSIANQILTEKTIDRLVELNKK